MFRRVAFAAKLSPNNKFEFLAPTAYDKDAPYCVCHLDESNDVERGTVLLASGVFADMSSKPPQLIRLLNIVTYRKSVTDYLLRVEKAGPLVQEVCQFFHSLEDHERGFSPSTYFDLSVDRTCVLNGMWLVSLANSDRCIAVSAFVHIILYSQQLLEVVLVCGYVTEPVKFRWMVHR